MRVKCIEKGGEGNWITVGEIYNVIGKSDRCYHIKDDSGKCNVYFKSRFVKVQESSLESHFSLSEISLLQESLSIAKNRYQELIHKAISKGDFKESKDLIDKIESLVSLHEKFQ